MLHAAPQHIADGFREPCVVSGLWAHRQEVTPYTTQVQGMRPLRCTTLSGQELFLCKRDAAAVRLPCQLSTFAHDQCTCLQVDKEWSAKAERPYDPYLTLHGEQQAKAVAAQLKKFDLKRVYISPFLRSATPRRSLLR